MATIALTHLEDSFSASSKDKCSPWKLLNLHTATSFSRASSKGNPSLRASRSKASFGMLVSSVDPCLPVVLILYFLMMTFLSSMCIVRLILHHFTIFMVKRQNKEIIHTKLRLEKYELDE